MYKNDIKRGDSYRFGEYAMAPGYDNSFVKKEIDALLERMGTESIEDLMFTAEGDIGANSALYLQPEGEEASSVTRVFVKTGEEWKNVPPLDFPVLHAVGYYMYVNIDTESYTGKISEVQLNAGPSTSIRNINQCVVITKEAFDIITSEAKITITGTDPFADAPEGFKEMMTKLSATSLDDIYMEDQYGSINIYGKSGNLSIERNLSVEQYISGD